MPDYTATLTPDGAQTYTLHAPSLDQRNAGAVPADLIQSLERLEAPFVDGSRFRKQAQRFRPLTVRGMLSASSYASAVSQAARARKQRGLASLRVPWISDRYRVQVIDSDANPSAQRLLTPDSEHSYHVRVSFVCQVVA